MITRTIATATAACLATLGTRAQGQLDIPTRRAVLDNGLTVVLAPDHTAPLVAVRIIYRVGSRNEHTGATGMAHFLEHMMFNGTETLGPKMFDRALERAGGSGNAYTTRDLTWYMTTVPPRSLSVALELEADRMTGLLITEPTLKNEVQVVLEERRQNLEDLPHPNARVRLLAAMYQAHPYRWPVLGWQSDIEAYDVATCQRFYRTHYAPNNAVLMLAGDFDPDAALALVRRHFETLPRGPDRGVVKTTEPDIPRRTRIDLAQSVPNTTLWIAFPGPRATDADHAIVDLIHEILSRGPTARLYRRLVLGDRIATTADLAHDWMTDPEPLYVEVALKPGVSPALGEAAVRDELRRIAAERVPDEELERAVTSRTAWLLRYGLATPEDRATFLGRSEALLGDHRRVLALPEIWRKITPEQVRATASKYFDERRATVCVLSPEER